MEPFDAAKQDWVTVRAESYFFEPWCTEYSPTEPGEFVITFGDTGKRHRGVEVVAHDTGGVSVWVPIGGRTFWCPPSGSNAAGPWEMRLQEWDHERGVFL